MKSRNERIGEILSLAPVVPVLKFDDVDQAVATAQALVDGGLPVIEITLRTKAALDCIAAVSKKVSGAIVGAGTVLSPAMANDCIELGAQFLVSPGSSIPLLDHARKSPVPLLPGVATPSETMALVAEGFEYLKFFPAEQAGGPAYLKALGSVFPSVTFCPTGGLNVAKAPTYLALSNVICVGGSWVAPSAAMIAKDWNKIRELAQQATELA